MIWPITWIVVMLGLVGATVVASMKEKKARTEALKQMAPQPIGDIDEGADPMSEGFGEPAEMEELDEDAFK